MIRGILTVLTFVSLALFPWPFAAFLACLAAPAEPLVPLAAGIFADTLYYAPSSGAFPLFALSGAVLTAAAFLVRSRLQAGIIGG